MYYFDGYIFDSNRLLIYSADANSEIVDTISSAYDIEYTTSNPHEFLHCDPDKMHMNRIALDRIGICLTYNCNFRCRYCGYSSDEQNTSKLELDDISAFIKDTLIRRTIKKLITKQDEPLVVEFTGGGEPTYDWELFAESVQLIKHECTENNIPVSLHLTTNGMLSNQQIDFISDHFNNVMVSYDGMPQIQNKNRISPYKSKTNELVENTIHLLSVRGIPLTIRSTIWQDDFNKMIEMYNHVFSLVVSRNKVTWSIYPVLFEGRAVVHIRHQENIIYKDFLTNYVVLVQHIISKEGEESLKTIDVPLFDNNVCDFFCGAHQVNQPWLLPDKSIVTCIESKEDKVVIGQVCKKNVDYYENYQDFLLKITQSKYVQCRDCIAYATCKGGCPIWHLRVDSDILEPLECSLQKEYWKYVVTALIAGEYSFGWRLEKIVLAGIQDREIYKVVKEAI